MNEKISILIGVNDWKDIKILSVSLFIIIEMIVLKSPEYIIV